MKTLALINFGLHVFNAEFISCFIFNLRMSSYWNHDVCFYWLYDARDKFLTLCWSFLECHTWYKKIKKFHFFVRSIFQNVSQWRAVVAAKKQQMLNQCCSDENKWKWLNICNESWIMCLVVSRHVSFFLRLNHCLDCSESCPRVLTGDMSRVVVGCACALADTTIKK